MAELKVYGAPWCPDCRRSKAFLSEHRIDYDWIDIDQDADALAYVEELQNGGRSIPTLILPDGGMLIEPSDQQLAQALGIQVRPQRHFYDLAIVGGGPAGLAASIYAAREGIDTVVIERSALGGQAGLTNRIDNYPGFPDGVDGDDLMSRFVAQARRFGVELLSAVGVTAMSAPADVEIELSSGDQIAAHASILTPGYDLPPTRRSRRRRAHRRLGSLLFHLRRTVLRRRKAARRDRRWQLGAGRRTVLDAVCRAGPHHSARQ